MQKLLAIFSLFFIPHFVWSQDSLRGNVKNSLFIEIGGNADESGDQPLWKRFSVNYERLLFCGDKIVLTARIGSNIPFGNVYNNPFSKSANHIIPLMLNLVFGRKKACFEVGAGIDVLFFDMHYDKAYSAPTGFIGLRFENYSKKTMLRLGVTPTIGNDKENFPYYGSSVTQKPPYYGFIIGVDIGQIF